MIIATAGHVDHGKTLLVKALTGVDTDRLPEEKKRGLTIELGFAYHDFGDGKLSGFIDVPGHERFIRTMLAGVSGIDFVIFVVAADDGPMPQTAEHLAIMDLLEIRRGVIALTKIDRVSAERCDEVKAQMQDLIANTSLANAPIIGVSALQNIGVDALHDCIAEAARTVPVRDDNGNFRLAVDRSFLLPGAGRVVTGTVFSGCCSVGDQLLLSPARVSLRVREIHAQSQTSEHARAGQRCALNVVGGDLRRYEISRGDWVVEEAACFGVTRFDARIRLLNDEPKALKNRTSVHVHVGAADVTGRVVTLESSQIEPGATGLVQIQLDKMISAVHGDHIILRDQSALRTIGGGIVLDPVPNKRGLTKDTRIAYLQAQTQATPLQALNNVLESVDQISLDRFQKTRNLTAAELAAVADEVAIHIVEDRRERIGITNAKWDSIRADIADSLGAYHREFPDRAGINDAELRPRLSARQSAAIYQAVLADLIADESVVRDGSVIRLPGHSAATSAADRELWDKVANALKRGGKQPPVVHDLSSDLRIAYGELNKFLMKMARDGRLVRVSDKRYFLPPVMREFVEIAEALLAADPKRGFSVKAFRDRAGIGRNAVIEILEYFDRVGYTRRLDQVRVMQKPASDAFAKILG